MIFNKLFKIFKTKFKKQWFSLIELVVVISILTILWTIGFINFKDFTLNARDSVRITDVKSIQKSLSLYIIKSWKYPEPTNLKDITYSWAVVWSQWTFWDSTFRNVSILNSKPVDPLKSIDYTYSVTSDRSEYELAWILESSVLSSNNFFINKTYANSNTIRANSVWSYNGIATKLSTWWVDYILALPSIITNNLTQTDLEQIILTKSLVYNNYWNLPINFSWVLSSSSQSFDFIPNKLVIYSWSINDMLDTVNQIKLLQNLKEAYSGTILLNNNEELKKIEETYIDSLNPSSRAKLLACNIVNFSLRYFVSCNDIDFITYYITTILHLDITNLPWTTVSSVFQTPSWNIWFWTNDWVWFYNWNDWIIYNKQNSWLISNIILAVAQSSNWDIWFWTNQWISVFNWTTWSSLNTHNSWLINNHILQIYTWVDWKIWIWTNAWVSTYDSWIWQDYTKQKTWLSSNHVNSIYEDNLWNIWFWTQQWLDKYTNWHITSYNIHNWLPSNNITYIMQDSNNNMWFWTNLGVSKYNRSTFTTKNVLNTLLWLASNNITYIYQNSNNWDLWFWTDAWASKYKESTNTWRVYNILNQLSWNIIKSISQNTNWDIIIINNWWADTITN